MLDCHSVSRWIQPAAFGMRLPPRASSVRNDQSAAFGSQVRHLFNAPPPSGKRIRTRPQHQQHRRQSGKHQQLSYSRKHCPTCSNAPKERICYSKSALRQSPPALLTLQPLGVSDAPTRHIEFGYIKQSLHARAREDASTTSGDLSCAHAWLSDQRPVPVDRTQTRSRAAAAAVRRIVSP